VLNFKETTTEHVFYALVKATAIQAMTVGASVAEMKPTYAGGLIYQVAGAGISSKLSQ
jgi:hypothetical protein